MGNAALTVSYDWPAFLVVSRYGVAQKRREGCYLLTVVSVLVHPAFDLLEPGVAPQALAFLERELEALFNLYPLMGLDGFSHDDDVAFRGVEGLVAAPFRIIDIFADNPPVI